MGKPIILSTKPKYAESIYSGEKKVEIRKSCPDIGWNDSVIIYETSPVKAVTGLFYAGYISQHYMPSNYAEYASKYGAVTKKEYMDYIHGAKKVVFIEIKSPRMTKRISLDRLRKIKGFTVPQSYRYLDDKEHVTLRKMMFGRDEYEELELLEN